LRKSRPRPIVFEQFQASINRSSSSDFLRHSAPMTRPLDYCICKHVRTNFERTSVNTLTSKDPTGTRSHPGLPSVLPTVLLRVRRQFIIQFSVQRRLQNSTGKDAWFFETIEYMWAKKKTLDLRYRDANQELSSNGGIRLGRGSSKLQLPQPRFILYNFPSAAS
jgi:hypothetical protein